MPFNSSQRVENRLKSDITKLTPEEVRELMPYMNTISEAGMRRLNAELSLQCLEAVQQFEKSSSRLTRWLIGLTVALVVLTVVIAAYTVVLAHGAHLAQLGVRQEVARESRINPDSTSDEQVVRRH